MSVDKFLYYESFLLTRFVKEWVYHGVLNDIYGEFMITVNDDYLRFRGKIVSLRSLILFCHNSSGIIYFLKILYYW